MRPCSARTLQGRMAQALAPQSSAVDFAGSVSKPAPEACPACATAPSNRLMEPNRWQLASRADDRAIIDNQLFPHCSVCLLCSLLHQPAAHSSPQPHAERPATPSARRHCSRLPPLQPQAAMLRRITRSSASRGLDSPLFPSLEGGGGQKWDNPRLQGSLVQFPTV